ncbi:hypothetical protein FJR48_07765 [Sulfurimonas lithotrophica]|uniref:Uncharacterized protein n=1 Tax=Sulfurimonas lithotrophica TaxID=2590022 RepID=A0A5P8P1Y3_9BACT|nr:hypothetical protein [Sulfurimonas lithotrophica]QFR49631.1 hypothetical protein FJR48_07765 [Sulfurimonas lithotrophica]
MGWKGTVRTLGAMHRASVREAERREREIQKRNKELQKLEALEQAAYEVEEYENYIETILSVHKKHTDLIDWNAIAQSTKPSQPTQKYQNEEQFKVGFFSKLLGKEEQQREQAKLKDEQIYQKEMDGWKEKCSEWEYEHHLANKLLSGDLEVKLEIIKELNPFSDIQELGSSLKFEISESHILEATLNLHGQDVIPMEKKALLQSGKLSVKKMPKGEFYEMYQDYVCSCMLRVGNELLAILPDELVLVHAIDNMLNSKTGHMEEQCILSIAVSRQTIESLNMDLIDPSDSFENFVYNMKFKKTKGFEVVEPLLASSFNN